MKILIMSMMLTSCGLPVVENRVALSKVSKNFSMIIRSEQGKRLANHLIELEVLSYLNRKTVQLANGVGVSSQEIADYLGISNKTASIHMRNSELGIYRVNRPGSGGVGIWLYHGIEALSVDAMKIDGIASIPYNHQPIIEFFTGPRIEKKLQNGLTVTTDEVAQAIGEVPNKQLTGRIKFLRDYLGIVQASGSQPRDGIWQMQGVLLAVPQQPDIPNELETIELIRQFLTTAEAKARLASKRGISAKEISDTLGLPWKRNQTFGHINRLKDELDIKSVIGAYNQIVWVDSRVVVPQQTMKELVKEFLARPEVIVKLENGEGITSKSVAKELGVEVNRIASQIGSLKGQLDIERIILVGTEQNIWIRRGVEPIVVRNSKETATKTRETMHKMFKEFFSRPEIAQRLTDGTGIVSSEIKKAFKLKSSHVVAQHLSELKDKFSIKPIRRGSGWVWINKDASYVVTKPLPPSLDKIFPSGLTLHEVFETPSIVERMTDGRGISSAEITKILGLEPQENGSTGQILRHSGKYLGIKLYIRHGDRQRLWMREGIEPTPNYRKTKTNR